MATLYHGVAPVNINKKANWEDVNDGRWFLSLYSNVSDEVQKRHTSDSISGKIELDENIRKKYFLRKWKYMTKELKIEKKLKTKRYEHKNSIASIIASSDIDKYQETKKYIKK